MSFCISAFEFLGYHEINPVVVQEIVRKIKQREYTVSAVQFFVDTILKQGSSAFTDCWSFIKTILETSLQMLAQEPEYDSLRRVHYPIKLHFRDEHKGGTHGNLSIATSFAPYRVARKTAVQGISKEFLVELAVLDHVSRYQLGGKRVCPTIVELKGFGIAKEPWFDMEYQKPLASQEITQWADILIIAKQLFSTLAFLHANFICHSDIKLENVLYNANTKQMRLVDFGMAHVICVSNMTVIPMFNKFNLIGNYWQMPPEALLCNSPQTCSVSTGEKICFNSTIDSWNASLLLLYLITKKTVEYQWNKGSTVPESVQAFQSLVQTLMDSPITVEEWNQGNFSCGALGNDLFQALDPSKGIWSSLYESAQKVSPSEARQELIHLYDGLRKCLSILPQKRWYAFDMNKHLGGSEPVRINRQAETPVLEKKYYSWYLHNQRTSICHMIKTKYGKHPETACRILYYYDIYRFVQIQEFLEYVTIAQEYNNHDDFTAQDDFLKQDPEGFIQTGILWMDELAISLTKQDIDEIQTFVEFITPARLLGISFLDYYLFQRGTDPSQALETMCEPEFCYYPYEYWMQHLATTVQKPPATTVQKPPATTVQKPPHTADRPKLKIQRTAPFSSERPRLQEPPIVEISDEEEEEPFVQPKKKISQFPVTKPTDLFAPSKTKPEAPTKTKPEAPTKKQRKFE